MLSRLEHYRYHCCLSSAIQPPTGTFCDACKLYHPQGLCHINTRITSRETCFYPVKSPGSLTGFTTRLCYSFVTSTNAGSSAIPDSRGLLYPRSQIFGYQRDQLARVLDTDYTTAAVRSAATFFARLHLSLSLSHIRSL